MRPIEEAKTDICVAEAAADKELRAAFLEKTCVVFRKKRPMRAENAADEGDTDDAAVTVTGEHEVDPQLRPERDRVVAVGEHDDRDARPHGQTNLLDQLLRRFLIVRAAGIVDAGDDEPLAAALQNTVVVLQDGDAEGPHPRKKLGQLRKLPFVISRDIIGRGNGDEAAEQRRQHTQVAVFVDQIAADADDVGLGLGNAPQKDGIVPTEAASVQVGQLNDAQSVEGGGKGFELDGDGFRLNVEVVPKDKQEKQDQNDRMDPKASKFTHKNTPFSAELGARKRPQGTAGRRDPWVRVGFFPPFGELFPPVRGTFLLSCIVCGEIICYNKKKKIFWMCMNVKYGAWNVASSRAEEVDLLCASGYGALTARVLSARGLHDPVQAEALLSASAPLIDPFEMKEMDRAVAAIRRALANGTKMAVFGDYDVDGITATCLMTDALRRLGATCLVHIPSRIEEGYGLNSGAIEELFRQGVRMIITVDCGITAIAEAELCKKLGITLIITDHHECKEQLPEAAALLDPHRPDATYPHTGLCGVGIAFKLASALFGDQQAVSEWYCDLICLGTIADVMPLTGENRRLVVQGLQAMQSPKRLGLRALINACDCAASPITASTIGYILAPRINAAGRMERAELAVELFTTDDPARAEALARTLCSMNRERQRIETDIYRQASAELKRNPQKDAIVLAGENWHQGVVGIVASRLSEEYCLPTFLICLLGEHGKASSRSYGGFHLFAGLRETAELLEGYGGHELAAGFTIPRAHIDEFRRRIRLCAARHAAKSTHTSTLQIDCELMPQWITLQTVQELDQLEPTGAGCAKPVFCLSELRIERLQLIGNGRHLRLKLRAKDGSAFNSIFFSGGSLAQELSVGDCIDVACNLGINGFHGMWSVQLNLLDLKKTSATELYLRYRDGKPLSEAQSESLRLTRSDVAAVWNYLIRFAPVGTLLHTPTEPFCLSVSQAVGGCSLRRILPCIEVLAELGLVSLRRDNTTIEVRVLPNYTRNPLENSRLFCSLRGD